MNRITYQYKNKIDSEQMHLVLKGVYSDQKLDTFFPDEINDSLENAMSVEGFEGSYGKIINIYTNGKISKIILVGLGSEKEMTNDKLRSLGAKLINQISSSKISSISIDSNSFNLDSPDKGQAFSEGLILGTYNFTEYKTKKNK